MKVLHYKQYTGGLNESLMSCYTCPYLGQESMHMDHVKAT